MSAPMIHIFRSIVPRKFMLLDCLYVHDIRTFNFLSLTISTVCKRCFNANATSVSCQRTVLSRKNNLSTCSSKTLQNSFSFNSDKSSCIRIPQHNTILVSCMQKKSFELPNRLFSNRLYTKCLPSACDVYSKLQYDTVFQPRHYFVRHNKVSSQDAEYTKSEFERKRFSLGPKLVGKENILTIPNLLTITRIVATPFLGYLVLHEYFQWSLGIFMLAGMTDLLDGYIARNYSNQTSALGTALDPLADKLLVVVLTISLTTVNLIPVPLTALIVARDVLLIAGVFYIRYISLPPPKTVSRYFDVTLATAKLYPSMLSKVNTVLQLSLVAFTLAAPVFHYVDHPVLQALGCATGITTFLSGVTYTLYWKKNFKVLMTKSKSKS